MVFRGAAIFDPGFDTQGIKITPIGSWPNYLSNHGFSGTGAAPTLVCLERDG
jgi:hypothetical protein